MILSLHYLRGIAALIVVMYHCRFLLNGVYDQPEIGNILFSKGSLGVDIFFMISGFIIAASTEKKQTIKTFALRRIFRVIPVYWVCLAAVVLIMHNFPSGQVLRSMLLINLDYGKSAPTFGYSVIFTAWTLSYEIVFYFMFMISMFISHKHRVMVCSFLVASLMVSFQYFNYGKLFLISEYDGTGCGLQYYFMSTLSSPLMLEFIFGMVLYSIYKANKEHLKINISIFNTLLIVSAAYVFMDYSGIERHGFEGMGVYAAIIFSSFLLCRIEGEPKSKVMMWLGDVSYSLYLSHAVLLTLLPMLKFRYGYDLNNGVLTFLAITSLSLLIAEFLHRYIEIPLINIGRKLSRY